MKLKVVFSSPVYTLAYLDPHARSQALVSRGPYDYVRYDNYGSRVRRLMGVTLVPGKSDHVEVVCVEDSVYGGSMRGQVHCYKVDGVTGDDAFFESFVVAEADRPESQGSDPGDDPDYAGY